MKCLKKILTSIERDDLVTKLDISLARGQYYVKHDCLSFTDNNACYI